ncbi:MAG: hypothetical protein LUD72_07165, partial [Bacteroidales bacterium]|nr:hypothetical protein [Bacteroidales bacterium]
SQWGCFIEGRIQLERHDGTIYSWSDAEGKWVQSDQTISTIYFDDSGDVVGNYVDNKATFRFRSDNNNDEDHTVTYGESGDLIGLKQSERFKYQDGEGYMMPLDSLPSGRYRLRIMLFAPWGYGTFRTSDSDHYHRGHWNWLQNYHILETLEDLSVTWHPECVTGTLPEITGGQGSGTFNAVYHDLKSDRSHVCAVAADDGEDVEINVDSWGDGSYEKWGKTLQPDICRLPVFDKISVQLTAMRRTIEYDDAVDDSTVPMEYTQDYGGESITLRKVGNSWKSSNEGGKKKFLQVIRRS